MAKTAAKKTAAKKPAAKPNSDVKLDKRNINRHNARGKQAVLRSLEQLGAGRSIVVDSTGTIIAGECTYEQATQLGMPVQVIESDGATLIVVKRTDLKPNDPKRRALAIADNKTAQLSEFDFEHASKELRALQTSLDKLNITGLDITVTGFEQFELDPLLAAEWKPPAVTDEDKKTLAPNQAGSGTADSSAAGLQSDGRAIYFGQDQFDIVDRIIKMAHKKQGDEASDSECVIWALLQVLDGSGF